MDNTALLPEAGAADLVSLIDDVVSAYVANDSVPVAELAGLVASVRAAFGGFGNARGRGIAMLAVAQGDDGDEAVAEVLEHVFAGGSAVHLLGDGGEHFVRFANASYSTRSSILFGRGRWPASAPGPPIVYACEFAIPVGSIGSYIRDFRRLAGG